MLDKTVLTWNNIDQDCKALYLQIKHEYTPDYILAVGRGGFIPATILSNLFSIKEIFTFSVSSYPVKMDSPVIELHVRQQPEDGSVLWNNKEKNILVVDDLSDKGQTLKYINNTLLNNKLYRIKYATLYTKISTEFIPDYYVRPYEDTSWLVFPWEQQI